MVQTVSDAETILHVAQQSRILSPGEGNRVNFRRFASLKTDLDDGQSTRNESYTLRYIIVIHQTSTIVVLNESDAE